MNFTKRDFKMLALGFFAFLIIDGIYNWKDSVDGFKKGYNSVHLTESNTK